MIENFLFGIQFGLETAAFTAGLLVTFGTIITVGAFIVSTLNRSPAGVRRPVCWFKSHEFEEIEVEFMGDPRKSIPITRCSRCGKRIDVEPEFSDDLGEEFGRCEECGNVAFNEDGTCHICSEEDNR